ncbi:MAG: thioredoxin [Pseudomonadota bacterium]
MSFTFSYGAGNGKSADPQAAAPGDLIKDATQDTFMADVIEASRSVPVIVDFWADWCGPCKQLTPVLEKAVTAAKGTVKLVKVNVDENREIAAQLRVQSLPTVYAFKDGRPVDAFMGALPESQIKTFIEKITGSAVGPSEDEMMIEAGQQALEAEDFQSAVGAFSGALQADPENLAAIAGLARALIGAGDLEGAEKALALAPEGKENTTEISSARAALEVAATPVDSEEIVALSAKVEADEKDHQSRIDLAVALNAAGRSEEAMEHLMISIGQDRAWNEEAARKQLLQFFEAWGHADERTVAGRRQLSSILFS